MTRDEAAAVVRGLAERGAVVGDERVPADGAGTYEHRDPATGRVQATVGVAGRDDVDRAVAVARAALPGWRAQSPTARARALFRLADLLEAERRDAAALAALDNGTPVSTLDPGGYAATWTRYYAGWVDKLEGAVVPVHGSDGLGYVVPEPYGVVAAVVPWNGPMPGMGQKAAAALAGGNVVVAKPPEIAPFGALRYAELALEAGIPPGAVNVLPGGAEAGDALVRHPGVDKVSFTGGTATARRIMAAAAETVKPLALELGGKSANIVFPDADLDLAVPVAALLGAVLLSGQGCALPTRLFLHDEIHDEVVGKVVAAVEGSTVGDPLDPATAMGPVVTEAARERILGVVDGAVASGSGRLLTGGGRLDLGGDLAGGWFVAPTVFADVDPASPLAREEVFGPVLSVFRFRDEDEVVAAANDSPYGLAAYVHTRDAGRAVRMARRLEVGSVTVNAFPTMSPTAPFGGVGASGFGHEAGAGLEEMVRWKSVLLGS